MIQTLRDLLLQGAARLQERPALTVPDWGTLSHAQFRNRVEGVALGLLAGGSAAVVFSSTGTAWDWAAEVAAAASGLAWDPSGSPCRLRSWVGPASTTRRAGDPTMTGSGRCWPPQGSPPAWTTGKS